MGSCWAVEEDKAGKRQASTLSTPVSKRTKGVEKASNLWPLDLANQEDMDWLEALNKTLWEAAMDLTKSLCCVDQDGRGPNDKDGAWRSWLNRINWQYLAQQLTAVLQGTPTPMEGVYKR